MSGLERGEIDNVADKSRPVSAPLWPDSVMPRSTTEERQLAALVGEIRACRLCRDEPHFLPGLPVEPRPVVRLRVSARVAICSQAPGTRVHASGAPFTDPSGVRLREWMGVEEADFYDASKIAIFPMGFCFPGQDASGADLPPRRECATQWRHRVLAALPRLELILLIGQYAQRWHLGPHCPRNLTETVRDWRRLLDGDVNGTGVRYLPMPHPSWRNNGWLKKNTWFERDVLPRLKAEVAERI